MSDIERIPSMRKPSRQGVPKRKSPDVPTPQHGGRTKDAPKVAPKIVAEPILEPTLPEEEPTLPEVQPTLPIEAASAPEPERRPEPVPAPPRTPGPSPAEAPPLTVREMVARVDAAWAVFRSAAFRLPAEHMNDHLTDVGWTRKQMLAHVAVWHDLTSDRLVTLMLTGRTTTLDRETDAINAAAARVASGKTAGEILKDVEGTFKRLRRQMLRLSDDQLRQSNGWAAQVIADNTYEHYAEHMADLLPPQGFPGSGARS